MSLAEMKVVAIEKINAATDEEKIQSVIRVLETGSDVQSDVDEFFARMVEQHDSVLRKLAQ